MKLSIVKSTAAIGQLQEIWMGRSFAYLHGEDTVFIIRRPKELGAPIDFDVTIREFVPKIGAGFVVALTGDVMFDAGITQKACRFKYGC